MWGRPLTENILYSSSEICEIIRKVFETIESCPPAVFLVTGVEE